jgi:hypothetical protein
MMNTRRRVLGLIAALAGASRFASFPSTALAAKKDCFGSKSFGPWKGIATDTQAGASIGQIQFEAPCDLRAEMQVAPSYDAKLVIYGNPDTAKLPNDFLIKPENRLIARDEGGKAVVDEPLCGACTEIRDDKVSVVLPLAVAPLLREGASAEIAVKLEGKGECRFKLDCVNLRSALDWASKSRDELARAAGDKKCTPPPEGCFITAACCEVLGLGENCFELTSLRRYRDSVLAATPSGREAISDYYRVAPELLARMGPDRHRLLQLYATYILPSAVAASLRLNCLAHRLYSSMMDKLIRELGLPTEEKPAFRHCDGDITVKQKSSLRRNQAPVAN